jgi:cytochrome c556
MPMRPAALLLITVALLAQAPTAEPPTTKPVASMSQLMLSVIYPYSDAIFYVEREAPKDEVEWRALESKTLSLAEIGNLLMSPSRARNNDQWMRDAQLLVDVGAAAFKAAKARDLQALIALNADLYESCQSCHEHYRPGYRRR